MSALDAARWQFGITTVYHFFFVPLTIGLSLLVAIMQTVWHRTGSEHWLRATKFFGKLFLINFAMGVVTGLVQEFQFGMNWSDYSRFVGDVFGAPLAIEGLVAFFLESTFLGLWIFGWDRLSRRVHLTCIWLAAIGTVLSAYFILAANSWMQHPTGFRFNPETGRAELNDFTAVLTQNTAIVTFAHTISACLLTGGAAVLGISVWFLARRSETSIFRPTLKLGAWAVIVATVAVMISGDTQAKVMTQQQPMKIAAAEALYTTSSPAPFSLFTIGTLNGQEPIYSLDVPGLLSFLATGSFDGTVQGVNELQAQESAQFGPGNYRPYIPVTYWAFRFMIGFGILAFLVAVASLWFTRGERVPNKWLARIALLSMAFPLLGNSFGWIFTEMGRQPWVVYGQLKTENGVSPSVGLGTVLTSLIVFTLLYGGLAVIEGWLLVRTVKAGPAPAPPPEAVGPRDEDADRPFAVAY
ncbi:cytochrome d ubiquinol oxidase subunit I [Actinomycetospora succinea]|uniref:Cytochrome d ubiquinol oxidase subunit I n=1 Tax=Actinomycetospora succinea TaxID=663603 RepID=A0A4V3D8R7_9PSEU|nr:cytochrome ubiquinol oxidase subunit I [Actinomycetospora succinea]TDQ52801.1 cytochrome d ubiquinol oxidase subunit I [Actinomycetospora succinea]